MNDFNLDFLVVGAMKAGTTTLVRHLQTNTDIACPFHEVHYFNNPKNYKKGLNWYAKHFSSFSKSKKRGEKTPAYSYQPDVAEKIYHFNPNIKLVWIFRNPVHRTYSHYWHCIRNGNEYLSFEDCLRLNHKVLEANIYRDYKRRSVYVEQVKRYLQYFSLDQMHFVIFESFKQDKDTELEKLASFLEIKNEFSELNRTKRNEGFQPASIPLEYYSKKLFGASLPWRIIHYLNKKLGKEYPRIDPLVEKELENYFHPFNRQLEQLIQQPIQQW